MAPSTVHAQLAFNNPAPRYSVNGQRGR